MADNEKTIKDLLNKISVLEQTVQKQAEKINRLESCERTRKITEEMREQAEEICQLRKENATDSLTGLLNRKGFEQRVRNAISATGRREHDSEKQEVTSGLFLMFDLDKFKPINDTYGHQAGDACLEIVGSVLNNMIRSSDSAGRLGGDEFVVFLVADNIDDANNKAHDIQNTLNQLTVNFEDSIISIGASMGVAVYKGSETYDNLYGIADSNLYTDKKKRHYGDDELRKKSPKLRNPK